ncbi:TRAP transporter small permease [Poseidonibacter antarcticus]|uniref:TRAP transporter small permease n=1 Tax=Poseidonibacter antarcticus TaxID=2478538 RepID=UPI000EF4DD4A|nr:TRAP transporter small permease [Poseidonibacter antarcticus]
MFNLISKTIGFINQSIAAFGITAGVAVAFTNVVARYAFDASLVWATELTIFLFLWSAFFGAAYCFKKDAHIAVTILLDVMPSKIAKIMLLISHTVTIIFLLAVAYYGILYITEIVMPFDERAIDLWDMPMWIIYLVIPIAFFFSAYRVGEKIVQIIRTPHSQVVAESEAEQVLAGMGVSSKDKDNKSVQHLNDIVKEVEKKTGGML